MDNAFPIRGTDNKYLLAKDREAWLRQPNEGEEAWEAFKAYLDMGTDGELRTVKAVADELGRDYNTVAGHARRWRWTERIEAYDNFMRMQFTIALVRKQREAGEKHANIANRALEKLSIALELIDPAKLTPTVWAKWLSVVVEVHRKALNMADAPSIVAHVGDEGGPIRFETSMPTQKHVDAAHEFLEKLQAIEIEPVSDERGAG